MTDDTDNVVNIREAVKAAKPVRSRKKDVPAEAAPAAGGDFKGPPAFLPEDAPVRALGKKGRLYFFLDSIGQLIELKASEIGRNDIIGLFGNDHYLKGHWPAFKPDGTKKNEWQHGLLSPILIHECTRRGLWDPLEKVRGAGCWVEEDGTLVMHCGDVLYVGRDRIGTGLRGSLLYPRMPRLPEPIFGAKAGADGPGAALLDQAETWNWARGDLDAKLLVGFLGAMILGAAPEWRPQAWITGGKNTGKSTLQRMVRWLMGPGGIIKSEDQTPASVSQLAAQSSLPVSLDELEAKANNTRVQETIELMRIAASGGTKSRGGQDGKTPVITQLRCCFLASSVLIPSLKPQDRSRLAILSLRPFAKSTIETHADEAADLEDEAEEDSVLGSRARWDHIGRQVRGRLIEQWDRYRKTFRHYRRALIKVGHDARAADQFGAIGAAYDLIMHNGLDEAHAESWAAMLPPAAIAETAVEFTEQEECLAHLLTHMPDIFRGGAKESVSWHLRQAREEILAGKGGGDDGEKSQRTLAKIGIRIWRDAGSFAMWSAKKRNDKTPPPESDVLFYVAVSHTHGELARIFAGTHWKGEAGAAGTWAQALQRLPDAKHGPDIKRRIDGKLHYVTIVPWESVFPPIGEGEEEDIAPADRTTDARP